VRFDLVTFSSMSGNIGYYTLASNIVGPQGQVIAIEAMMFQFMAACSINDR
jgi:hypothetical protein